MDCLQVRGSKRLGCNVDFLTVSRCRTRGESEAHTSEKERKKGSTLAINLGQISPDIQNTGISVQELKDL